MEFTITGDASKVASPNVDVGMLERAPRQGLEYSFSVARNGRRALSAGSCLQV